MSIAKELIKQHKKLDVEIKKLTKTRLNDRTSSSWKSLKELKNLHESWFDNYLSGKEN